MNLEHEYKELDDIQTDKLESFYGNTLEHYGVLGMKWGVRKDRVSGKRKGKPTEGTSAAQNKKNRKGSDSKKAKASEPSKVVKTDEELQTEVNRLRLEKEYARLTAAPPAQRNRVAKAAAEILLSVAKKQTEHMLNTAIQTKSNDWMQKQGLMNKPQQQKKKKKKK